mgnify:CR=1 FL=1
MQGNLHRLLKTIKHEHAIRLVTAKAFRPYLITECGNKSDVGLLLTLKKDKTMKDINVDELYVPPSSVFSNEQKLKSSL